MDSGSTRDRGGLPSSFGHRAPNGVVATLLVAAIVGTGMLGSAGCHDDDHSHDTATGGHTSPYPSCNEITQSCHEVDVGDGPIHDCHDKAHAATGEADCSGIKAACLALCAAAKVDGGQAQTRDGG